MRSQKARIADYRAFGQCPAGPAAGAGWNNLLPMRLDGTERGFRRGVPTRWVLVFAVLTVVALQGCGGSKHVVSLGASKPALIEGIPVPSTARLTYQNQLQGPAVARYQVEAGLAQVDRWYGSVLPAGRPWQSWRGCSGKGVANDLNLFANAGLQRIWLNADGRSLLTLSTAGTSNGPVTIIIVRMDTGADATPVC